ncbi:hypothetical protein MGYG_02635 [Nannizzia gypsea CBS 118893]|uniref:Uncharacterized protein n=1 Tax=Arthroderma gypseum (strain ATCC MYA-4604 / CBS 118893) TaxID=535722 RepID=E4UNL4_ARTGP|nr:hypothetical protein MGYG_02635 [Nannizzia gypsea CBS 118893]EFQ99622.1 hypothetical protein MGYG_02635 [Nannizzia gypsea CBS 118893]
MARDILLIIYNRSLFKAHWAIYVPSLAEPGVGKKIHVYGDVLNGFTLQFLRNYALKSETLAHQEVLIQQVKDEFVLDGPGGEECSDILASDRIEEVALSVAAPWPSLNSASANSGPPTSKAQLKDCQSWVVDVVAALVDQGIMSEEANDVVRDAPKH